MSFKNKFASLGAPRRIWAVSALGGDSAELANLHAALFEACTPGDRIVYTGNYLAQAQDADVLIVDEILHFRRALLARFGHLPTDIVYLRGTQEELWYRLLNLQITLAPQKTLAWIMEHHPEMNSALKAYGSSFAEAEVAGREGVISLTRWTSHVKDAVRRHPGHETFFSALRRAAFTDAKTGEDNILFVHAGIDPQQALADQGDNFFWSVSEFSQMQTAYHPFRRVIRGFDPEHRGLMVGPVTVSLGASRPLCAAMSSQGEVLGVLAA